MNKLFFIMMVWLLAFGSVTRADTPDMPIEACYIGAKLDHIDGYIRVTIRNGMCDNPRDCYPGQPGASAMIYGIRSLTFGGKAEDSEWAHNGQIYMLEGLQGQTLVRTGTAVGEVKEDSKRVSVLRPGEECSMWLKIPTGHDAWRLLVRRLTPLEGGEVQTQLRYCAEKLTETSVTLSSCMLRFDTAVYDQPQQYGVEDVVSDGNRRTISWRRTLWSDARQ